MKKSFSYLLGMFLFLNACDSTTHSEEQSLNDATIELNQPIKGDSTDSLSPQSAMTEIFPGMDTLQLDLKMEAGQKIILAPLRATSLTSSSTQSVR